MWFWDNAVTIGTLVMAAAAIVALIYAHWQISENRRAERRGNANELWRETLLHEMGHACIDHNVAHTVRERFTEMGGLRAWNQSTVPWDDRAYEHGAEIIAWGLGNRYMAPSIPDRDPAGLAAGFEFLTRVPFPNPSQT